MAQGSVRDTSPKTTHEASTSVPRSDTQGAQLRAPVPCLPAPRHAPPPPRPPGSNGAPPPGCPPERWERDQDAPTCRACGRAFTLFTRRHHCRRCGRIYCYACTAHRMRLSTAPSAPGAIIPSTALLPFDSGRVCDGCYRAPIDLVPGAGPEASAADGTLRECPACNFPIYTLSPAEGEKHVRACLEQGVQLSGVQRRQFRTTILSRDSVLIGEECVICLDEFTPQTTVARLPCLCCYHPPCITAWLSRNHGCPVHAFAW